MTIDQNFYVTKDKKITVPMMQQSNYVKYADSLELDAKVVSVTFPKFPDSCIDVCQNQYLQQISYYILEKIIGISHKQIYYF